MRRLAVAQSYKTFLEWCASDNMKISIITPCLNAEASIERAIESVTTQNYPHWEHIVIDGGSTDKTLDILAGYPHLKVKSGHDAGQADAMNKGIEIATGDVIGFLNADDYYFPGAFLSVAEAFDDHASFVIGNVLVKSKRLNAEFLNTPRTDLEGMLRHWEPNAFCHNPVGYFYRLWVQQKCPFNAENYESMDLEFLLAAAGVCKFKKIEFTLGCFEDGHNTKTDKTQLKADYWRPSTFPYIAQYIERFPGPERIKYESDRREGYALQQANTNQRARERVKTANTPNIDSLSVSVIIPTYNDLHLLHRSIDSALTQSCKNLEVLIVDDASDNDVSAFISEKYSGERRISVHRHASNKMLGGARNSGVDLATSDYIFFLDSDDRLLPGALTRLLTVAVESKVDVIQCGSLIGSSNGNLEPYHALDFASDGGIDGLELFSRHKYASVAWNKLYRHSFLQSSGGIRFEEKYMHEDVAFAAKTAFLANGIVSISDPLIHYTVNKDSLTQKEPTRLNIESYLATYLSLIKILEEFGVGPDKHRDLFHRILTAHGSSDFAPKLANCYDKMGPQLFRSELMSVAEQRFGAYGSAIGDLICHFLTTIHSRQQTQLPQSQKYSASWLRRLLSKINPNGHRS
jgi:glycosyltransferase involved in cell wall biosynthesis